MANDGYIPSPEDISLEKYCDESIERCRKTDGTIFLKTADGQPLAGAEVNIRLKKHAFNFGGWAWTPVASANPRVADSEVKRRYVDKFCGLFNYTTAMMYWDELAGFPTWEKYQGCTHPEFTEELLSWTRPNNITVKGHTLVWTKPNALPSWYKKASRHAREVYMENHVRTLVGGWRGIIDSWDVVNECIWEVVPDNLGIKRWAQGESLEDIVGYVGPAFRWAREENPAAELLINDYGLEYDINPSNPNMPTAKRQRELYRNIIMSLGEQGAPPDGIGLQTHGSRTWFEPEVLHETWDYFAETGIPLHITEAQPGRLSGEIEGGRVTGEWDEAKCAYAYRQFYKLAFAYPSIKSIITYDTLHYGYRWDCKKPDVIYDALYPLISGEWGFNENITSGENGEISFRGFYGDYEATVRGEHRDYVFDFSLSQTMQYKNSIILTV